MNYKEYQALRSELLPDSDILDFGDTNFYEAVPTHVLPFIQGHKDGNVYRCHLAEDFIREYHLSIPKTCVSVSEGVRSSVNSLFRLWENKKWVLPADQYPFYLYAAENFLSSYRTFVSNPYDSQQEIPQGDVLLYGYPAKPFSYANDKGDIQKRVNAWLAEDDSRVVVLDCVYNFALQDSWLTDLVRTQKGIVLYSLSKAFSSPFKAGFTISASSEVREAFKASHGRWKGMKDAYTLLNHKEYKSTRDAIKKSMIRKYELTKVRLLFGIPPMEYDNPSYLFFVPLVSWEEVLSEYRILTIPPSIYNIRQPGIVVSTLHAE